MSDSRRFVHDMKNYLGIVAGYSNLVLDELTPEDPHRPDVEEIRRAGEAAITLLKEWSATVPGEEEP
jgi:hypothetical protein